MREKFDQGRDKVRGLTSRLSDILDNKRQDYQDWKENKQDEKNSKKKKKKKKLSAQLNIRLKE